MDKDFKMLLCTMVLGAVVLPVGVLVGIHTSSVPTLDESTMELLGYTATEYMDVVRVTDTEGTDHWYRWDPESEKWSAMNNLEGTEDGT